jgi:hypothetical protein
MSQQHPITPPPSQSTSNDRQIRSSEITPPRELVEQWEEQWCDMPVIRPSINSYIATQAAQWGADQELEACVKWVSEYCPYFGDYPLPEDKLRADRRPEPPSLKEHALALLDDASDRLDAVHENTIRRALEDLDD